MTAMNHADHEDECVAINKVGLGIAWRLRPVRKRSAYRRRNGSLDLENNPSYHLLMRHQSINFISSTRTTKPAMDR